MPDPSLHKDGSRLTILILVSVWILTTLGTDLISLERHETLVLQAAREMLSSGDWILPQFNGEPLLHQFADWKALLSGYYLYTLLLLTLPACLTIPYILFQYRKNRKPLDTTTRLLLWVGATFLILFTIGGHYRKHYLIPLLPLASLLLGNAVYQNRIFFQPFQGRAHSAS